MVEASCTGFKVDSIGHRTYLHLSLYVAQVLVTLVLATKALSSTRCLLVGFLATSSALLMICSDKLLNVVDIAKGNGINISTQVR